MNWSVDETVKHFKELIKDAFCPRAIMKYPGLRGSAQIFCQFRYKTEGIVTSLQKSVGKSLLFGHAEGATGDLAKVGVVAAYPSIPKPLLFTNYSRNPTQGNKNQ